MVGGGGDDQLWGSGRGAIGGVDVVPLQPWMGAVVVSYGGGVDVVPSIIQKLVFAIWGLCW